MMVVRAANSSINVVGTSDRSEEPCRNGKRNATSPLVLLVPVSPTLRYAEYSFHELRDGREKIRFIHNLRDLHNV